MEFDKFAQNHRKIMEFYNNVSWRNHGKFHLLENIKFNLRYASDQHIFSFNDITYVSMRVNRASWKMSWRNHGKNHGILFSKVCGHSD